VDFTDEFFKKGLRQWLNEKKVTHDLSHVRDLDLAQLPKAERELGAALAKELKFRRAIVGVFDEGCMGMFNAIVEDTPLNKAGMFKERLSQSALVAAMQVVPDSEAQAVRDWLDSKGLTFVTGKDPVNDLTDEQILEQCKMYIAALRIADRFGCDAIGIQYQQGLKDSVAASDLVEGLLNNADRPPVKSEDGRELYADQPLPHFNEVDECHAVDAIVSNRVLNAMHFDPATTLHDVRWGEQFIGEGIDDFVWIYMISGAVPAAHIDGGYAKAVSRRQPSMFFPHGGGTLEGVGKPGEILWSRVFVEDSALHVDMGRASVVRLPEEETKRRWAATNPEWPIVHVVLHGVSRDQFMARHRANHNSVAYAPSAADADKLLAAKAAMYAELGVKVHLCGV
ncbi:MAG: fucose isomerase, partial [Terracidiphilus sp.]|nr:fucose isomerase [Terracidiphilus sp.]